MWFSNLSAKYSISVQYIIGRRQKARTHIVNQLNWYDKYFRK